MAERDTGSPPRLEDAIALAAQAHRGQIFPTVTGEPYILHPLRVILRLESETERIVAALHDVVEDTAYTLGDLRRLGYGEPVIEALDRLTRRPHESYEAYVERVAGDPVARRVKLADLADNLANNHALPQAGETRERIARYERAQRRLQSAERGNDVAPR